MFKIGDKISLKIVRLGQVVTVSTIYKEKTYTTVYTDFDFTQIDSNYFYLTMFATRSTLVKFSNLNYIDNGEAQGA